MNKISAIAKKHPLSALLIICIWVLCLVPYFPETPLDDVSFIDKWTHLVMFGTLSLVLGGERMGLLKKKNEEPYNLWSVLHSSFLISALMGGLIELAQAYLTFGHRSGDWLDWLADIVGAFLGALLLYLISISLPRHS